MKRNNIQIKPYISKRVKKVNASETEQITTNNEIPSSCIDIACNDIKSKYHSIPKHEVSSRNLHTNVISALEWHPLQRNIFASSSFDKTIIIWKVDHKNILIKSNVISIHGEAVKHVEWSRSGTQLLTASLDKTAKLYDVISGKECNKFEHSDKVTSVLFHPTENNIFLSGTSSAGIYAWDTRQNDYVRNYCSHFGEVQDLLFLPNEDLFVSSAAFTKKNSLDKTITVWDFKSSAIFSNHIYQEPYTCSQLKSHPNNKSFLAQSAAGYIAMFDVKSPWKLNKYKRYKGHQSVGYHIGFDVTSNGSFIYCGDSNGYLYCYDGYTSNVKTKLKIFESPNVKVACSKFQSSMIVCGSWNGKIALWE